MNIFKKAFTMAEVLSVLIILGVVAAITIPNTMKRMTERETKTKILKAISAYDKALSQYYLADMYQNYQKEYKGVVLDPNNELEGLSGDEYTEKKEELNAQRTANRNIVKNKYVLIFSNYFSKSNQNAESPNIFKTKDGLWWDIGTNGNFLSVMVATKEEYLNSETANSNENKAFYFIAEIPNYAKTPIVNPTYGKDLTTISIFDLKSNSTTEISNIIKLKKLYSFLKGKSNNKIYDADKICTTTNCCYSTKGSCLYMTEKNKESNNPNNLWYGVVKTQMNLYDNGKLSKYYGYDETNDQVLFIDYNNKKVQLKKDGEDKCYAYKGVSGRECSIEANIAWGDLYSRGETCCMGYCSLTKETCE